MKNNYHTYAHTFRSYLVSVVSLTLVTFFSFGCSENTARSELKPIDVTQNLVQADQADNIQTYQDPNLGLSFDFAKSWIIVKPEGDQKPLIEVYSPDSSIIITILHDYPPPTIDLKSYGDALINNIVLKTPSFESTEAILNEAEKKYVVDYLINNSGLKGSLIIILRDSNNPSDSFIVQSLGKTENYTIWEEQIKIIIDSITVN